MARNTSGPTAARDPQARASPEHKSRHEPAESENDKIDGRDGPHDVPIHPEQARGRIGQRFLNPCQHQLGQADDQPEPERNSQRTA